VIGYGHHPLFLYLEPIMEQKDYLDRACDSFRKWTVLAVNEELGLLLLKDGNRVIYVVDGTGSYTMPYYLCLAQQELYCYMGDCPHQDVPCISDLAHDNPHKLMSIPLTYQEMSWLRHQDIYDLVRSAEG